MQLRRLLLPAVIAAALALPAAAFAGNPTSANDPVGDAGGARAIDITQVTVRQTDKDYRQTVTYDDLTAQKASRWYAGFFPSGAATRGDTRQRANVVEFRRNPAGATKVVAWTTTGGGNYVRQPCAGVRAYVNDAKSHITFIVPTTCWAPTTGQVGVDPFAQHFTSSTWDGSAAPLSQDNLKTDTLDNQFTWYYGLR